MENSGILNREKLSALIKRKGVLSESIARTNRQKKILREFKEQNDDICLKIDYLISEGFITEKQVAKLMREAAIFVIENNRQVINESVYHSDFIGESLILERVYNQINESWLGDKWNSAKNWVSNSAKKVVDAGKKVVNGAVNAGKKVVNGAADMAKAGWKWAKNRYNNLDIRIALKDGVLDPNFEFDKIEVVVQSGEVILACHNTRRWVRSEDCILKKGGAMIYNNKQYKWSSAMAVTVAFLDAVTQGAFIGGTLPAVGGIAGFGARTVAGHGLKGLGRAASLLGKKKMLGVGATLGFAGLDARDIHSDATKATPDSNFSNNLSQSIAQQKANAAAEDYASGSYDDSPYDGYDDESLDFYSSLYEDVNRGKKQQLNEFAVSAALICAAVGAVGGGILSAVKNKNNIIYYSNGTYKSKQGNISGYWDGTTEAKAVQKNGANVNGGGQKINENYYNESLMFYKSLLGK